MLVQKLSRTLINKASKASNNPWALIPSTETYSAIITNGSIAMKATMFQVKQFELAWGKELSQRNVSSHDVLQRVDLSKSREIRRTCILSDEQLEVTSRMYMDTFGTGVFFNDALLNMIGSPDVLQIAKDAAVDDIDAPSFWITRRRSPKAEKVFSDIIQ